MFLSRVLIGSYRVGFIRVGSFRGRVYSDLFLSVPILSGKRNLDQHVTYVNESAFHTHSHKFTQIEY